MLAASRAARWRTTPHDAPFLLHLGEGIDEEAQGELPRLEALGCLQPNTVIVHGVAIDENGWRRVARAGAGLVWCPASNAFLFGRTAMVWALIGGSDACRVTVALGTDSRVTGSLDLLDELRAARAAWPVPPHRLFGMVTSEAGRLLRAVPRLAKYMRKERPALVLSALDHINVGAIVAKRLSGTREVHFYAALRDVEGAGDLAVRKTFLRVQEQRSPVLPGHT